jgi:acyl carrier protein
MLAHAQIEPSVRQFVVDNYLFRKDASLRSDDSLIGSGLIDSTGILELVSFLEATFAFPIADEELVPENLDSIGRITHFVEQKLSGDGNS